jgi:hypothetical protein
LIVRPNEKRKDLLSLNGCLRDGHGHTLAKPNRLNQPIPQDLSLIQLGFRDCTLGGNGRANASKMEQDRSLSEVT